MPTSANTSSYPATFHPLPTTLIHWAPLPLKISPTDVPKGKVVQFKIADTNAMVYVVAEWDSGYDWGYILGNAGSANNPHSPGTATTQNQPDRCACQKTGQTGEVRKTINRCLRQLAISLGLDIKRLQLTVEMAVS